MQFSDFVATLIVICSFHRTTMAAYEVEVATGDMKEAGTWDNVYATLFGTAGQSERTELDNYGQDFNRGTVSGTQFCACAFMLSLVNESHSVSK